MAVELFRTFTDVLHDVFGNFLDVTFSANAIWSRTVYSISRPCCRHKQDMGRIHSGFFGFGKAAAMRFTR